MTSHKPANQLRLGDIIWCHGHWYRIRGIKVSANAIQILCGYADTHGFYVTYRHDEPVEIRGGDVPPDQPQGS